MKLSSTLTATRAIPPEDGPVLGVAATGDRNANERFCLRGLAYLSRMIASSLPFRMALTIGSRSLNPFNMDKIDRAYKSIGEFVVVFQWIENTYREIGWLILDPHRKTWPPEAFRTESNRDLLNKVTDLFCELVDR